MTDQKKPFLNCRLFVQITTGVDSIESLPKAKKSFKGAILWWGNTSKKSGQGGYRHVAIDNGDGTATQVPEWGADVEVVKISDIEKEYGPVNVIYDPRNYKKENPKYLTPDKVEDLQGKKLLNRLFSIESLKNIVIKAQSNLLIDFDDYNEYEDISKYRVVNFGNDNLALARFFNLTLKPNDEGFFEELDEVADKVVSILIKNYPLIFTSPYYYNIEWDEGDFVFNVALDSEGRKELQELGEEMKKENPRKKAKLEWYICDQYGQDVNFISETFDSEEDAIAALEDYFASHDEDAYGNSLDDIDEYQILCENVKKQNPTKESGFKYTYKKYKIRVINGINERFYVVDQLDRDTRFHTLKEAKAFIDSYLKKANPSYLKSKFAHFDTLKKLCRAGFEVYLKNNYRDQVDCEDEDQLRKAFLMPEAFFTSDLFRYTDYGGGYTAAKANIKYIEENYSDLIDQELISIYSTAHSGENCEFSLECLSNQSLVEELLGLDGYPILSDDTLSEVEMELEDECWDSYGRDDFKKELEEAFGENVENLSDDEIDSLAFEASQYTSEGKGHVEAMQFYFDNDAMIEALKELNKKSKGKLMKKENPSIKLANPEWASDHDVWEKAKKQSIKEYGKISYPFVVFLYKQMGGKVKKKK